MDVRLQGIDVTRSRPIIDPDTVDYTISVIGAGATGSRVVMGLVRLGIDPEHILVYDFDRVEPHNLMNQVFQQNNVGEYKVEALAKVTEAVAGKCVLTEPKKVSVEEGTKLYGFVFVLTDTMESRKEIFESMIKAQPSVNGFIETRMGVEHGMIYTIDPHNHSLCKKYADTLQDDGEVEKSACGTKLAIGQTAEILSGLAVWQFVRYHKYFILKEEDSTAPDQSVLFSTRPMHMQGGSL